MPQKTSILTHQKIRQYPWEHQYATGNPGIAEGNADLLQLGGSNHKDFKVKSPYVWLLRAD